MVAGAPTVRCTRRLPHGPGSAAGTRPGLRALAAHLPPDGVRQSRRVTEFGELRAGMRAFVDERDWGRFHDPKSVLLAMVGEVGELAELLQWLPAAEVTALAAAEPLRTRVGEEMADVLLYLVLLADVLGVDLAAAAREKLRAAHRKHPAV